MNIIKLDLSTEEYFKPTKEFLIGLSYFYPGIDKWWDSKVVPGITTGERVCYIVADNGIIKAVSIGKLSDDSSKLCTLRVAPDCIGEGLGTAIVVSTLKDLISHGSSKVHFTANDEVMAKHGKFFEDIGFKSIGWENNKYVNGTSELIYSADLSSLKQFIGDTYERKITRDL